MSDLENFHKEHGDQWNAITQHPAFSAAMNFLNIRKINGISQLSDEQIESHGKLVLADLRGHLQHENDLLQLSAMKDFEFGAPPPEDYPSPAEELGEPPADVPIEVDPPKSRKKRK